MTLFKEIIIFEYSDKTFKKLENYKRNTQAFRDFEMILDITVVLQMVYFNWCAV